MFFLGNGFGEIHGFFGKFMDFVGNLWFFGQVMFFWEIYVFGKFMFFWQIHVFFVKFMFFSGKFKVFWGY